MNVLPYRCRMVFVGVKVHWVAHRCAARDAEALSARFSHFGYWQGRTNTLLVNETAVADDIRAALHACVREERLDLLLLYWAGHMLETSAGHFLVTHDSRLTRSGIRHLMRLDELTVCLLAGCAVKNRVLVLDTCHAGTATQHLDGLRIAANPTQRLALLAACAPRENAREDAAHGYFTGALLQTLKVDEKRKQASIDLVSAFQKAAEQVSEGRGQNPFVRLHGLGTPLRIPVLRQAALPFEEVTTLQQSAKGAAA